MVAQRSQDIDIFECLCFGGSSISSAASTCIASASGADVGFALRDARVRSDVWGFRSAGRPRGASASAGDGGLQRDVRQATGDRLVGAQLLLQARQGTF